LPDESGSERTRKKGRRDKNEQKERDGGKEIGPWKNEYALLEPLKNHKTKGNNDAEREENLLADGKIKYTSGDKKDGQKKGQKDNQQEGKTLEQGPSPFFIAINGKSVHSALCEKRL